ncbi:Gfo/Idh/MocA family protein [Aestuariispira ectoiniformans]|uniref:Gfo/Idh/MocA family protein n=1 Tax=Aestuariispira ectoiniformans TaxID=2775080 RepID=UPI00223C3BA7|nr:Gfo/Idh/MocA family oxidoreductase [Aestuariispira ectoiniformans]
MPEIGIGLIGTGFMGKCHAMAFQNAASVFNTALRPRLTVVADIDEATVSNFAGQFGFGRWTTDWTDLINDPHVDIVAITTPNFLHKEMALAAIAAGKHVYCEKPLALTSEDALEMTQAAERAGVKTMVGYNYLKNPATALAREIIASGEIGDVVHFRGIHNEDYMGDPTVPHSWRCTRDRGGAGALGDIGSHIISIALYLAGDIRAVNAQMQTVIEARPDPASPGTSLSVENDDQTHAMVTFESGAMGTVECSRIAQGRKMHLAYEVTGTKGSIVFDQEQMNELHLFTAADQHRLGGFRRILIGPDHPHYGAFCPAPGHSLGFNDQKVIEVKCLLDGIDGDETALYPGFRAGYEIEKIIDAMIRSDAEQAWVQV